MFGQKFWLVPAALALMLGGCGLNDYQKRMTYEQERVKYEEKENELLGPPIRFHPRQEIAHPDKTDKADKKDDGKKKKKHDKQDTGPMTPKLFLRLPISIKSLGHEVWPEAQLFRFPSTHPHDPGLQEVCVGEGYADDKSFRPTVLKEAQKIYDTGEFKLRQTRTEQGPLGGPSISFERYEATVDANVPDANGEVTHPFRYKYTAYFHKSRGTVVAIVLRQAGKKDLGDPTHSEEAIQYSLRTLALGPDMAKARKRYRGP